MNLIFEKQKVLAIEMFQLENEHLVNINLASYFIKIWSVRIQ